MPGPLLRAILHFDKSKIRLWVGLRNAVGVALPVIAGALLGSPSNGMIAGLGALNVAVGDGSDPYRYRLRRMTAATLLGGLAVAAGTLFGGHWYTAMMLAPGAFAAGMMVAVGTAEADIGLITLVTLITFSARPGTLADAVQGGLLALGGGVVQTLLSIASWPLGRQMPERRALAALYRELGRSAAAGSPATEAPPASLESTAAQQALASLDARDSITAERFLALLSQAERLRLTLLALARLRIRIGRQPDTGPVTALLDRAATLTSGALRHVADGLLGDDDASPSGGIAEFNQLAEQLRAACAACSTAAETMVDDARIQTEALGGQLRTVLDLATQTTARGMTEFEKREAAQPWKLQSVATHSAMLANLSANLRLESAAFRHALRLAASVAAGQIAGASLHWSRPYWVPMTVALVLKPDFTTTFSRGLQRLLGTFIGLALATALFHFLPQSFAAQIVLVAIFTFLLRGYGAANYGIMAICVTALVVLLFAVSGISPAEVIAPRALNTLTGGLIALLAYRVWPTWERTQTPEVLAHLLDAYRAYFQAVRDAYLGQKSEGDPALDRARLAARVARSQLEASVARMRNEPGTPPERTAAYDRVLADSHRFIHSVMSLEAGLLTSSPAPAREPFRKLTNDADVTLYYLSAALRGASIDAAQFPDLREDYHALMECGAAQTDRYALVNIEADRIVNSVNTLRQQVFRL